MVIKFFILISIELYISCVYLYIFSKERKTLVLDELNFSYKKTEFERLYGICTKIICYGNYKYIMDQNYDLFNAYIPVNKYLSFVFNLGVIKIYDVPFSLHLLMFISFYLYELLLFSFN